MLQETNEVLVLGALAWFDGHHDRDHRKGKLHSLVRSTVLVHLFGLLAFGKTQVRSIPIRGWSRPRTQRQQCSTSHGVETGRAGVSVSCAETQQTRRAGQSCQESVVSNVRKPPAIAAEGSAECQEARDVRHMPTG